MDLIKGLEDSRILIYQNKSNIGPIKSFEKAILKCNGDYIFLSDQDDVWEKDKVSTCVRYLKVDNINLVIHDAFVVDSELKVVNNSWDTYNKNHFTKNITGTLIKNPFCGAMMAFKKELKEYILPFPDKIDMHDIWIGLQCQVNGIRYKHINDRLIKYRRHDGTVTGKRKSITKMIKKRMTMFHLVVLSKGKKQK